MMYENDDELQGAVQDGVPGDREGFRADFAAGILKMCNLGAVVTKQN